MAEANSSVAGLQQEWQQFLSWWKQHLWECVPASLRDKYTRSRRPAMLAVADDRFWAAGADLGDARPFAHSAMAQSGGGEVALVVGEQNGFRRQIEFPLAVEAKLGQVLGYELDRLTPLKASELYYDFRIVRRNTDSNTCAVELVATPRMRVDPMIEAVKQKGLTVSRILLSAQDVDSSLDLQARAAAVEEGAGDTSRWINWALGGVCVLLLAAIIAFPLWQMRQYVIELLPVEANAKAEAETASVLQRQLEKQVGEYNLPLTRKHSTPLVVQVLDDLSKRLPEDTWAQTVDIKTVPNQKTKEVSVQGETGSGGKILQIVQESPLLKDPTFKAAMTRVAPNAERFHIVGELVAAGMPQQVLLSDDAAAITVPPAPSAPAGAPATKAAAATASPAAASTAAPAPAAAPAGATAPAAGSDGKRPATATPAPSPEKK